MDSHVSSPIEIARALVAAENAGDVDGVMAFFAPDPTVRSSMDLMTTTAAVRLWQEELAVSNLHIEMKDIQAEGNIARWTGTIAVDFFRKLGLDVLDGAWEIAVDQDKITSFTFSLTPDSVARVQSAMQKG